MRCGVLVALMAATSTASTDQAQTSLGVSTHVVAIARIDLVNSEPVLLITDEDLQRGFVDIPEPLHLTVYSNSRNGYFLDVLPVSPVFSTVSVQGLDSVVLLPADGGTVTQRWGRPQTVALALRFRFTLVDGMEPGRYSWPVRLAARPLPQ